MDNTYLDYNYYIMLISTHIKIVIRNYKAHITKSREDTTVYRNNYSALTDIPRTRIMRVN